jgi:hypothetical protein
MVSCLLAILAIVKGADPIGLLLTIFLAPLPPLLIQMAISRTRGIRG